MNGGVAVCAATFRRPEGLGRLLAGLAALEFAGRPVPELEVIVVDNDAAASGRAAYDARPPAMPWPSTYLVEPVRGISRARNRAVREAIGRGAELIALVDDDEVPCPAWLERLLDAMDRHGADVVQGPILRRFEAPPPRWLVRGGFYEPDYPAPGEELRVASSGNVLFKRSVFELLAGFDPHFDLSGGEDTHFFLRARRSGFKLAFCREAEVYETFPAERATARWLLRRRFGFGCAWSRCGLRLDPGWRTRLVLAGKGLAMAAAGSAAALAWVVRPDWGARAAAMAARGAGQAWGALGGRYDAYLAAPR